MKPSSVFKYRSFSELERDLTSLEDSTFYAPNVVDLNDPVEAKLVEPPLVAKLRSIDAKVFGPYSDLISMRHKVGIYSLSRTVLDEVMWSHYGESHKGFCIEYNLERLVLEARKQWDVISVEYSKSPPSITFRDIVDRQDAAHMTKRLVGNKSMRWAYEEELRIVTTCPGLNHYAESAVTGIYFGCRMPVSEADLIRTRLAGRGINYYRMQYPDQSYELKPVELQHDETIDGAASKYEAEVDEFAVPEARDLEEFAHLHSKLLKAVQIVRSDKSCEKVQLVDVSRSGKRKGKIFVTYDTNVPGPQSSLINRFFNPDQI